jgi:hypothetical protein
MAVTVCFVIGVPVTEVISGVLDCPLWHAPIRNPNTKIMHDEIINFWYLRMTQPYRHDLLIAHQVIEG